MRGFHGFADATEMGVINISDTNKEIIIKLLTNDEQIKVLLALTVYVTVNQEKFVVSFLLNLQVLIEFLVLKI